MLMPPGDNFACLAFQLLEQGIPDFSTKVLNALDPVTSLVNKYVGPVLGGLSCPQLGQFDNVSSAILSHDVRTFANTAARYRGSLILSLAAITTRRDRQQTTSKCSEGYRNNCRYLPNYVMGSSMKSGEPRSSGSCTAPAVTFRRID
jgi:hypothetical protein